MLATKKDGITIRANAYFPSVMLSKDRILAIVNDMSKLTSKLQLTVPKAIADQYGIRSGDELQWIATGEAIRVVPAGKNSLSHQARTVEERLELFDRATERQKRRQAKAGRAVSPAARGWKREELYDDSFHN